MKIVMIDQDGVVCDKNYQVTKDLKNFVGQLQKSEVIIVPNSDTPVARLSYNFENMLGLKPSIIIGEKGAVIRIRSEDIFLKGIKGINNFIFELVNRFSPEGVLIAIGDSATWIRNRKKFKPNSDLLIIDAFRQQSIGFYLRTSDLNGIAQINEEWAEKGRILLAGIELPQGLEIFDYNQKYGIFISNAKGTSKTDGFRFLKEKLPESVFFMIGDGDIDIIEDDTVIHCAVANASDLFKEKAIFVAEYSFTHGLEECLNWIITSN